MMIVALDATALILLLDDQANGPLDASTNRPVQNTTGRMTYLASQVSKARGRLVIPAPAFAEAIVKIEPSAVQQHLTIIERSRFIRIAEFNKLAALELAAMQRSLIDTFPRRLRKSETSTRSKVKFDQQIVSIAKVERADVLVSDDDGLVAFAKHFRLKTLGIKDLDEPPSDAQGTLPLEAPGSEPAENGAPA